MAKRRGNRDWGKPHIPLPPAAPTTFETMVQSLRLSPDQYLYSGPLRDWVERHKDNKYVPPELLKALGLEVNEEF